MGCRGPGWHRSWDPKQVYKSREWRIIELSSGRGRSPIPSGQMKMVREGACIEMMTSKADSLVHFVC